MTDYGFKKPSYLRTFSPEMAPHCLTCHRQLLVDSPVDLDKSTVRLFHPIAELDSSCPYVGRFFEMELDVRYLKEVSAPDDNA